MKPDYPHMLTRRNSWVLLLLGFSSGLPLALTSGTLQAWMTAEDVDLKTIGFFSLVGQAYIVKFIWSPLMDRYSPRFLGRRRSWLLVTQCLLAVLILTLGCLNPSRQITLLAATAVLIAFCSASQDIVFDAWKTDSLTAGERGKGAAISVLGYRLAMLVSGGLALWLADKYLGWQHTYWLMAVLMLPGIIGTRLAREPASEIAPPLSLQQAIVCPLKDFFSRNNAWLMITLIVCYKLGDAFANALTTTFLMRGLGFSAADVGLVNKSLGLIATIAGALYGGVLMQRLTLYRALMTFGILQAMSNLAYWLLTVTPRHLWSMAGAVCIENLCAGMGTAAAVALLMSLCNRSYSATQFALLSALSAVGRVYVGPVAGWLVERWQWPGFYAFSMIASLPGLLLLWAARASLLENEKNGNFTPRTCCPQAYRRVTQLFTAGVVLLLCGGVILASNTLFPGSDRLSASGFFSTGLILSLLAVAGGVILDCLVQQGRIEANKKI